MKRFAAALILAGGIGYGHLSIACPPGVPIANNPSCIPPSVPGSPYYIQPVQPAPEPVPLGEWISYWGAIAGDVPNERIGTATNKLTKQAAMEAAIAECRKVGGKECKPMFTFLDQCGALAWPTQGGEVVTARNATLALASKMALDSCAAQGKGCKVVYSGCALPEFRRY